MVISLIWFILRIPGLIGTSPLSSMIDVGQRMSQTAGAALNHSMQQAQMIVSAGVALGGAAAMVAI
jgi:hypothetical protein